MRPARERGFSIIEVIVAVVVVAIGLTGLVAMSGTSARSSSVAKVRDQQSSIAQSLGDKIRGDAAWAGTTPDTCATVPGTVNLTGTPWLNQRLTAELANTGLNPEQWIVNAQARKVDSPADGVCPNDQDGVLPDYFDVDVSVRPHPTTLARFPGLKPFTTTFQVNFSNRNAGGALTVQACHITPQVDERLPIGTCASGAADRHAVLPPPGSNVQPSAGDDFMSCVAEPLDCTAYRCAHPEISDGCAGEFGRDDFVKVRSEPGAGWRFRVTGDPSDPVTRGEVRSGTLGNNGEYELKYMKVGRYRVEVFPTGNLVPWASHSVPANGWATVVSGVESRVVQMYKPGPRREDLVIPIETTDVSKPPWFGQSEYDYLYKKGPYELILVPIPRGRVLGAESGTIVRDGDQAIRFRNLEPGLYGAYMADPKLISEYTLTGTKSFLFVPPGGGDPIVLPSAGSIKWEVSFCDPDVRQSYVNMYGEGLVEHTTVTPTGVPVKQQWMSKPCTSPGGGPPPVGSGGAGGA